VSQVSYILPRIFRRYLPSPIVNIAKRLRLGIVPGLETRHPEVAADRYEAVLQANGREWNGKCVLILGYGGFLGLGVELLHRGARHVILVDPYAQIDHHANRKLPEKYFPYLTIHGKNVLPNQDWVTLVHEEVDHHDFSPYGPIDLILSSSVLEHVSSLDTLIHELSKITDHQGLHIHYVDLRDHFFKFPFEMLCFHDKVWDKFLDPPSHLNRLRLRDYKENFTRHFHQVVIEIIERDLISFQQVKSRIRSEFLSGDDDRDCTTRIVITASDPVGSYKNSE
jgi:hypothetical protein